MEKRILGIILSVVGGVGVVASLLCITGFAGGDHAGELLACGIVAAILFFAGLRLVPEPGVSSRLEPLEDKNVRTVNAFEKRVS